MLIAGPTASGKSALALALAERDGGCIINADASQVYACWRVLTARPDAADLARAPHRLYGHVSCAAGRYSVGHWLRAVMPAIAEARRAGLRPIVVGGTGLYFHALTHGLSRIPPIPAEVRVRSQAMLAAGDLDGMLRELDPGTRARIDVRNPMRVQRAWEVLATTGRGLADWQDAPRPPPGVPAESAVPIVLDPEISSSNRMILARFHLMIEQGAIEEARRFADAGFDPDTPAGRVLGAPALLAHLRGALTLDQAVAAGITGTRQFAKRQRSWFRNRMPGWLRLDPGAGALAAVSAF